MKASLLLLLLASCGQPVAEARLELIGPGSYPEDQRPPDITDNRWQAIREQSFLADFYATEEEYFEAQRFGLEHLPASNGRDNGADEMVLGRDTAHVFRVVAERALFELQQ